MHFLGTLVDDQAHGSDNLDYFDNGDNLDHDGDDYEHDGDNVDDNGHGHDGH